MNPLVSVVIPTTDRSEGFSRCINSVITQTYYNVEVIVVGNNCIDFDVIPNIISDLNDDRVKYVYLENCANANIARNYGADVCSGEYVAYMDSDDYWDSTHIESCISCLVPSVQAIYSGYYVDNGISLKLKQSRAIEKKEDPLNFLFGTRNGVAQTSSFFLSKSVFSKCHWDEDLKRNQDYDFFIKVQDEFGWFYKEKVTSYVFWSYNAKRSFHYESYLKFYTRYRARMSATASANYATDLLVSYSLLGSKEYNRVHKDFIFDRNSLPISKRLATYGYPVAVLYRLLSMLISFLRRY